MLTKTTKLDRVLLSLWKMFKYSSIKQAIFEQAQEASKLNPIKVLDMHDESCVRIISRFQSLIDALYVIFFKRGDVEKEGVRSSDLLLMLLLLVEILNSISMLSKYLQMSTLVYTWITVKVKRLIEKLHIIKKSLSDP